MKTHNKRWMDYLLILVIGLFACKASVSEVSGPSANGRQVGVTALGPKAGLPADGASQATVRVEVFDARGLVQDAVTVALSTTLGTLASKSLTTSGGVATTTLTAGTAVGTAYIVATVDNTSATTSVSIVNMSKL